MDRQQHRFYGRHASFFVRGFLFVLFVAILFSMPIVTASSEGRSSAFSEAAFLSGALRLDLETRCREVPGSKMTQAQVNRIKLTLAADLDPLFDSSNPPEVRARVALYLKSRQMHDRALKKQERFGDLLKALGSQRREEIISALTELHALVLSARDLRRARADLAAIEIKKGKVNLRILETTPEIDFISLAAWVAVQTIEGARALGVDCTSDPLYPFLLSKAIPSFSEPGFEHADLRNLDTRILSFLEAWTQPAGMAPTPAFTAMMGAYSEVQENHNRALSMLGKALALYARHLSQVVIPPPSRDIPLSNDPDLKAQVREIGEDGRALVTSQEKNASGAGGESEDTEGSMASEGEGVAASEGEGVAASEGEGVAASEGEGVAASEGEGRAGGALTQTGTAGKGIRDEMINDRKSYVSSKSNKTENSLVSPSSLSAEELGAALVKDVLDEVETLRTQKDAAGRPIALSPMGVALNILSRLKRVAQIGDMLAEGGSTKRVRLAAGQIKLSFSPSVSALEQLKLEVAEIVGEQVVVEWTMTLTRKDDSNFRIDSEFNHIRGFVEIERGEVLRAPNIHQLIVLMNRVDALMASNRPAGI